MTCRIPRTVTRSGFTLLELMLVVIIIGILLGLGISGLNMRTHIDEAKTLKTQAAIAELNTAIKIYEAKHNQYPPSLHVLVDESIMKEIKTDGWNQPLRYNHRTGEVSSLGGEKASRNSRENATEGNGLSDFTSHAHAHPGSNRIDVMMLIILIAILILISIGIGFAIGQSSRKESS